jgi:hypothetical protein
MPTHHAPSFPWLSSSAAMATSRCMFRLIGSS